MLVVDELLGRESTLKSGLSTARGIKLRLSCNTASLMSSAIATTGYWRLSAGYVTHSRQISLDLVLVQGCCCSMSGKSYDPARHHPRDERAQEQDAELQDANYVTAIMHLTIGRRYE